MKAFVILFVTTFFLAVMPPSINLAQIIKQVLPQKDTVTVELLPPIKPGLPAEEVVKKAEAVSDSAVTKFDKVYDDKVPVANLKKGVENSRDFHQKLKRVGRQFEKIVPAEERMQIQTRAIEVQKKNLDLPSVDSNATSTKPKKLSFWERINIFRRADK